MSELSDKHWAAGNFAADNSSRGVSPAGPAPEYKTYYGTKRVEARLEHGCSTGVSDGYIVRYPDGYLSWSPKGVFEAAYQPLDEPVPQSAGPSFRHLVGPICPPHELRGPRS